MKSDQQDLNEWSYPVHMVGMVTTLPPEPDCEAIRRLHEVVEEVTGKPVEQPPKQRIGFLP